MRLTFLVKETTYSVIFLKFWIESVTFVKDFVDFDSICWEKQIGAALNI